MLACVSSAEINLHETLSTLQYATRARAVQNKVSANVAVGVPFGVGGDDGAGGIAAAGGGGGATSELQAEMESSIVTALRTQIEQMQLEMTSMQRTRLQEIESTIEPPTQHALPSSELQFPVGPQAGILGISSANVARAARAISRMHFKLSAELSALDEKNVDPSNCGIAWNLVAVCRQIAHVLGTLEYEWSSAGLGQTTSAIGGGDASTSAVGSVGAIDPRGNAMLLRSSLNASISSLEAAADGHSSLRPSHNDNAPDQQVQVQALQEEVRALRLELEECREDLMRDEDIFAEKIKELKRSKRRVRELEAESKAALDKQEALQTQLRKLAGTLMKHSSHHKATAAAAAATAAAANGGDGETGKGDKCAYG